MIDLPPKTWRLKAHNRYIPIDYGNDIDDGVFEYSHHGRAIFRPSVQWANRPQSDIILFDKKLDMAELLANISVGKNILSVYKTRIQELVVKYWDCFCKRGAKRTILDYEFSIDTGASKAVYCCRPLYGLHEKLIIMEQINALLSNNWIEEYGGAWGSQIVLAVKPHQEHIDDIREFVWRMCVSYGGLNKVTKIFEYSISRCNDAILIFQVGSCLIWVITVDAR